VKQLELWVGGIQQWMDSHEYLTLVIIMVVVVVGVRRLMKWIEGKLDPAKLL